MDSIKKRILYVLIIVIILVIVLIIFNDRNPLDLEVVRYKVEKTIEKIPETNHDYLNLPIDICTYKDRIYVADTKNNRVLIFSKKFKFVKSFGKKGYGPGEFIDPSIIQIVRDTIYVNGAENNLQLFNLEGGYIRDIELKGRIYNNFVISSKGNIFIGDPFNEESHIIKEYDRNGNLLGTFGRQIDTEDKSRIHVLNTSILDIDSLDNIYVAFYGLPFVRMYDQNKHLKWQTDVSNIPKVNERVKAIRQIKEQRQFSVQSVIVDICHDYSHVYILCSSKIMGLYALNDVNGLTIKEILVESEYPNFSTCNDFNNNNDLYFVSKINHKIGIALLQK